MKRILAALVLVPRVALPFCGFYVAKADAKVFNRASRVVVVREGDRTALTMANDFQGDAREFAVVVPVPTRIERSAVSVVDMSLLDQLDAYSAPRLVEYFDPDPCAPSPPALDGLGYAAAMTKRQELAPAGKALGVTIEASYSVGEYDILILSAEQSAGLETWLRQNGYGLPPGAASILGSYLRQGMHFFVAKVNLGEQARLGLSFLRPLQVRYTTPRFMLPIRLGTVSARGPQDLFVYAISPRGRVETTNYRTVRMPSGMTVPDFVKDDFKPFIRAVFDRSVKREEGQAVFTEYAWDMASCDPCAADPLSPDALGKLGVVPGQGRVFLTRLHVRYDASHFPEDLQFQETSDRENFQGRFVLQHRFTGPASCEAGRAYSRSLGARADGEAATLANLTGWEIGSIRARMR
jgi:hypothetical protein